MRIIKGRTLANYAENRWLRDTPTSPTWKVIATFSRASLRDTVNLAQLRQALDARSPFGISPATETHDLYLSTGVQVGWALAVNPAIDADLVDDFLGTIQCDGTLSYEDLSEVLYDKVIEMWGKATTEERFRILIDSGYDDFSWALEEEPPSDVANQLEQEID